MAYLSAKIKEKQLQVYSMDLLWAVASRYYDSLKKPSDIYYGIKDRRSAKQIMNDIVRKLGGE